MQSVFVCACVYVLGNIILCEYARAFMFRVIFFVDLRQRIELNFEILGNGKQAR